MSEGKPVEIPDEDWAQTPPAVRAFVSRSVARLEQLEMRLQAAQPQAPAISTPLEIPAPPLTPASEAVLPRLRPRRTLNRLALIALAVAGAAIGQGLLAQDSLWDGLLFYGVAVLLWVWSLRGVAASSSGQAWAGLVEPLQLRPGIGGVLGGATLTGSLLLSLIAYRAFGRNDTLPTAWNFYGYSLLGLVAGVLLLTRGGAAQPLWPPSSLGRWLLGGVFLLAVIMRLWQFDSLPFGVWYDEAISGLQGVRWNVEPAYRPQFEENNSGQLLFLYATALRWFGHNPQAIRLISAALGLAGVVAAYLFGNELKGPRFGLALAFLVAVARWHVNFSRIAMPGVDTVFTEFLALFFLTRLWRYGSLRDAAWAGVVLGLGLSLYSAFRLFVVALAVFVLLADLVGWRSWWPPRKERQRRLNLGSRLAMLGVALWLTALPVIHFAGHNPTAFWARVQKISIINRREEPDLGKAIGRNIQLHLLMFNFQGDRNGRHNLPGEPMLDPIMGVIFVLGFGLALARLQQPANLFFVILFPIGLLGGVLSLDFEAPQSLRSIAVLPAVFYFCALSLAVLGRQIASDLRPWPLSWLALPALALAGLIFYFNAHTYFYRQAQDFASWNAFSTAETIIGQRMAKLGPDYVFYLSPFFHEHPSIRFLSPQTPDRRLLTLPDALPIRQPADRPAALFIHPDDRWLYQAAQDLYPAGKFETISHQPSGTPVVYIAELRPEDLKQLQGLELAYWSNPTWTGLPQSRLAVPDIELTWPDAASLAASSGSLTEFAAEWTGVLYAPAYGRYEFALHTPAKASLEIDGQTILTILDNGGLQTASLRLAQGNHRLRLRAQGGVGPVSLSWQRPDQPLEVTPQWAFYRSPVANHGLEGNYYANANWEGTPVLARIDPFLDTYFHITPLPRPYTVEWTGVLVAPQAGSYGLGLRAIDWAQLYLDNKLLLETSGPDIYTQASINLNQGAHDLRLRFKDATGRSRLHLWWQPPGQAAAAIPSQYLWPSRSSYIEPAPVEQPSLEASIASPQAKPLLASPTASAGQAQLISTHFGETALSQPRGIAVGPNGWVYVADTGNRRLLILDQNGNLASQVNGGAAPFEELADVAADAAGQVYVLDAGQARLSRFDGQGKYLGEVPAQPAYLAHSRGLFVDNQNRLWLANTPASRLVALDLAGNVLIQIPVAPELAAQPVDVAVTPDGHIYGADIILDQLIHFGPDGQQRESWTIPHSTSVDGPHLAVDAAGSLYLTLPEEGRVIRFDPGSEAVKSWELPQPDGRRMKPVGVAVAAAGQIWTVDSAGGNIVVLTATE